MLNLLDLGISEEQSTATPITLVGRTVLIILSAQSMLATDFRLAVFRCLLSPLPLTRPTNIIVDFPTGKGHISIL